MWRPSFFTKAWNGSFWGQRTPNDKITETLKKLALAFAETIGAAHIGDDLAEHIGETPRPGCIARRDDVQAPAVRYGRAAARRPGSGNPTGGGRLHRHFLTSLARTFKPNYYSKLTS